MTTIETPTALDAARFADARGWRPFPIDHPGLPTCIGRHRPGKECAPGLHKKRGKHPAVHWPTATATQQTEQMLAMWFGQQPRNIGIACKPSGLFVVDEDEADALDKRARQLGERVPDTYRVRTGRGWHWYFEAPTDITLGNDAGRLADFGMDVRGGSGDGGYVVGAGSVHWTGALYVAEDDYKALCLPPTWLINEVLTPAQGADVHDGDAAGDEWGGPGLVGARGDWTDDPRYGSEFDLMSQYQRHLAAIRSQGNAFRHELFVAARDGWRMVALGCVDRNTMLTELAEAVHRVWGAAPDLDDKHIVYGEAQEAAQLSPWVLYTVPAQPAAMPSGDDMFDDGPAASSASNEQADEQTQGAQEAPPRPDPFELEVLYELRKLDVRDEAKRRRVARERANRTPLADKLIDVRDLAKIPAPRMLMGELIPHASIGFLSGKFGSYKSFVAISISCSLAVGKSWQGRDEFHVPNPVSVLYVAAEGAAGVAQRILAWEHAHGAIPAGQLAVYPEAINLGSSAEVEELAELVEARKFGLVVIDTYNQSTPGVEENSATEFGVVFAAMAGIRARVGTTTLFVDHTGHDGLRTRGSAAKEQASDFVMMAHLEEEDRSPSAQRVLRMRKRKDLITEGEWPIRLRAVPEVGEKGSAYLELGNVADSPDVAMFGDGDKEKLWWRADTYVPDNVAEMTGRGTAPVRDIYRVLAFVDDVDGVSFASLKQYLGQGPVVYGASTVQAALALMIKANIVEKGLSNSRYRLVGT